jgi:hypothetical protein
LFQTDDLNFQNRNPNDWKLGHDKIQTTITFNFKTSAETILKKSISLFYLVDYFSFSQTTNLVQWFVDHGDIPLTMEIESGKRGVTWSKQHLLFVLSVKMSSVLTKFHGSKIPAHVSSTKVNIVRVNSYSAVFVFVCLFCFFFSLDVFYFFICIFLFVVLFMCVCVFRL